MKIYCCGCKKETDCHLKTGADIYPNWKAKKLEDAQRVAKSYFWQCPTCKLYVGCHPKSKRPLGALPTQRLRRARLKIHDILDPLWKKGRNRRKKRTEVYTKLSNDLGYEYHTAAIIDIEEAKRIYRIIQGYYNQ